MSAGNIKLNLKEFKHVSSDKDSTTLEHKKGHKLVLAHNSLSPESQEQLKALAKGGNPKLEESKKVPPKQNYDEGGIVDSVKKFLAPDFDAAEKSKNASLPGPAYPTTAPQSKAKGGSIRQNYPNGGRIGHWDQQDIPAPADAKQPPPAQTVSHKTETSQSEDYKKMDDQEAAQNASRSQWDPAYKAKGGKIKMAEGGPTPDPGLPCLNPNCKSHGKHHPNCRCYSGMAEGGYVETKDQDESTGKEEYFCDMPRHHFKGCEYVKAMKDGGEPDDAPAMQDVERGFHHQYIEPDKEESLDEQNKGIDKEIEDASNYVNPQGSGDQSQAAAPMAPEAPQQNPPASSTIQPDANAQAPAQPQTQAQQPDQSGYQDLPAPVDTQQQQGNYDPKQDLNPIQRFQNTVQNYDQNKQNILQGHINEADAWKQDLMNGHVTPMTYQDLFAKKSTTGKIGTLFGLLLSGAGSGLAHQPNMVMGMMNQEIQNDLNAQQHSKENAINYYRLAQAHEANKANIGQTNALANTSAIANSKARMDWSNFHQLVTNTQGMPEKTPQQVADKQKAMQALAYMNDEIQKAHVSMFDKLASAQAAAQVVGGGLPGGEGANSEAAFQRRQKMLQAGMMGPKGQEISKMETARHLPGVAGSASRDVSPQDADKFNGYKTLDNQLQDLKGAVNQYSNLRGNIDPKVIGPMAVKAHEAAALYNKTLDGLGMTEGRMGWLENQIPSDPQKFMERLKGSKEKLEEVANNNNMRKNTMLSNYGFPAQTQGIKPKPGYNVEQHNGKNYYVPIKKK